MAVPRRPDIVRLLRQRLLRAMQAGTIAEGARLPSTRELSEELAADPRVVAAAYRELEAEGLVALRARSGVFLAASGKEGGGAPAPSSSWMARVFAEGIARGVPAPALGGALANALGTRRHRAAVIATTTDQGEGLSRELRDDFGLDARGVLADAVAPRRPLPRVVQRSHLLVTTAAHGGRVAAIAARIRKPHVVITVRLDLYEAEWGRLRGQEAFVLVADPRFAEDVRVYLESLGAANGVRVLVAGRDDLAVIRADAIVYATQAARQRIGRTRLPGFVLPPARMLSEDCARDVMRAVLEVRRR
jgi:DNA-binding transcriptional regulator YhcF (GntR family)